MRVAQAWPLALAASLGRAGRSATSGLRGGGLLPGVSVLFGATLLGQAISLGASPVLTRLYAPGQFGVLAIYTGVLTVLTAVASLRYDVALPIARSDQEAAELLAVSAVALALTVPIAALAMLLCPAAGLAALGLGALTPYRLLVPIGFACLGAYGVLVSLATRDAAFGIIARTRLTQAVGGSGGQILFGMLGFGTIGLLAATVFGQCAGMLTLARHAWATPRPPVTLAGIAATARRYRAFPLVSSWGVLADMIGGTLALYLLSGLFYSATVTGFLFLTDRVVGRPLGLMITSLAPVMFSAAGRDVRHDPARLRRLFVNGALYGGAIAALWIAAVNGAAMWLFPRLFGPAWAGAVPYIHAVGIWYFSAAICRVVGPTLQVLERQFLNAVPQVGGPVLGAIGFALSARAGLPASRAVLAYAGCQALAFVFTIAASFAAIERIQPRAAPP